jgi:hypothetical protein
MSKIAISFSSFLSSLHKGLVKADEINEFWFGCRKEHVLRPDGKVPYEVTWQNTVLPSQHGEHGNEVAITGVDDAALHSWVTLRERMVALDELGKVVFQATVPGSGYIDRRTKEVIRQPETNYWDIARYLMAQGHQVFLDGRWLTLGDVKPA